ncbi:GLUG motif-containing protein [Cyclobacterium sp. SYSU L10401]|uniref:GLUG motif-containing protein n=1 Tax=Cyclobacterium sp. SYSU L10401 TaxID=2678657 RepID=UPI0013D74668|nr:GLUG motif-containing protein [Cyclobacterium sp. SYSU L10401]
MMTGDIKLIGRLPIAGVMLSLTGILLAGTAMAGPSGGTVVDGAADIAGQGSNAVTVNQHSNRAVINWQRFDTQSHQRVEFVQPDVNSIVLNRIISGSPTQFDGSLSANGRVVVMNPNGVVFGQTAQVDVGSLIATSSHVSTDSFMNDARIRFEAGGDPAGSIVNHGTITVRDAGLVGFVAPHVENTGTITARLGKVHLASGDRFTFDLYGDGLVEIAASDAINAQLVKNNGVIEADGGVVQLEAASAKTMVDGLVSNTGVIEAKSVHEKNGVIILSGDAATTSVSGTVDASGKGASETGGRIEVTGKEINLASARLDASGSEGGGTIRIGGGYQGGEGIHQADTTTVDADTTITADAITNGDGGSIVVWSNELTDISATLSAKGGLQSGDGGMIETSSKGRATFQDAISIDTSAPNGETGLWYIDPEDFTIADVGGDITPVVLSGQLGSNNVTIETADTGSDPGDIVVEDALSWGSDRTLILNAHRDIDINASINNTTGGSLVLRSDKAGSGTGTVSFNGSGSVAMTGGGRTDLYYNPSAYSTPTDYSANITGDSTAWMLVHDVNQLQAINTNNTTRAGSYALSGDIDASDTVNWDTGAGFVPIGNFNDRFTGQFDGQNHIISDLYIDRSDNVGLFGLAENSIIRNVGLVDVGITGDTHVGGLAGRNVGNSVISNSYATGNITGNNNNIGGLVGVNSNSTISSSYSTASVTGNSSVGGLVGYNNQGSTVSESYATGDVMGTGDYVGGLVGYNLNNGIIDFSYATGNVMGSRHFGGLVGYNNSSIISESYATGTVTGNGDYVGGLVGYNVNSTINESYSKGMVTGNSMVGGLVGRNQGGSTINQSYATGTITGNGDRVGGLVGVNNNSTINHSYSVGTVAGLSNNIVGGLVGYNENNGTVSYSYATGAVSGANYIGGLVGRSFNSVIQQTYATGAVTGSGSNVGGLVGTHQNGGMISYSYATGSVSKAGSGGGLVGQILHYGGVTNSYWDMDTSGMATSAGGAGATGLTTAEMQEMDSFSEWDIDDAGGTGTAWRIYEGQTSPLLRHFMTPLTVTANNASAIYDGTAYMGGNGVVWSGFKDGGDATDLSGVLSYGGTAQNAVNTGNYSITPMGVYSGQQGYDITTQSGTLTIVKPDMPASTEAGRYSTVTSPVAPLQQYSPGSSGVSSSNGISTDAPMYNVDILNGGINLDNNSFDLNLISPSASGDTDTVTNLTSNAYTIYFTKPLLQQLGYLK